MPRYFENALLLLTGRTRTPLPSLSNSSLSPLRTPSIRRTSRGTVICPLLVMVACFCISTPIFLTLPCFPYCAQNSVGGPTLPTLPLECQSGSRGAVPKPTPSQQLRESEFQVHHLVSLGARMPFFPQFYRVLRSTIVSPRILGARAPLSCLSRVIRLNRRRDAVQPDERRPWLIGALGFYRRPCPNVLTLPWVATRFNSAVH
jgi:hypothetical protein